ncbi:MAG: hypothetical protein Q4C48_02390 [Lachnospiraceae bacterium]|nr:hypothetical protein [Lachnospiraceae bacterium]
MLGIVYLSEGLALGFWLLWRLLPEYVDGRKRLVPGGKASYNLFFVLPASFLSGTLLLGWLTYLTAWAASHRTERPLLWADRVVIPAVLLLLLLGLRRVPWKQVGACLKPTKGSLLFFAFCLVYAGVLMCRSFWYADGVIGVGETNAGDFEVHLSMIRSFSHLENVPADYTLFAGSDLKYHFMFDFLAGNLEFLGLRLDLAVNLPSILGLAGMLTALAGFGVRLSGSAAVGYLAGILAGFRSSFAVFDRFFSLDAPVWKNLLDSRKFAGSTILEDWGIYSPNVYVNQRHFAFGMAAVFLMLILFLPYLGEGVANLRRYLRQWRSRENSGKQRFLAWLREDAFPLDAHGLRLGVFSGLLLGMVVFWNGPAAIASLLILFVLAFFSSHKLTFAYTGLTTVLAAFLQLRFFADGAGTFSVRRIHGWILKDVSLSGYARHFVLLLGLVPLLLLFYALRGNAEKRLLLAASLAPLVFGFTVQMTRDVNQNSKYMMLTFLLFAVFCADVLVAAGRFLLVRIAEHTKRGTARRFSAQAAALLLFVPVLFLLTANGIYDYYTVCYKSTPPRAYQLKENEEFLNWIEENVEKDDLFLCAGNYMSHFTYAGVELYLGYALFPWTVGYDTEGRKAVQERIYTAPNVDALWEAAEEAGVRYIVVSPKTSQQYAERSADRRISETFPLAFSFEDISIYEVPARRP